MLYCIIYCLNKNKSAKTQTKISIANNAYEIQEKLQIESLLFLGFLIFSEHVFNRISPLICCPVRFLNTVSKNLTSNFFEPQIKI